ncbi:MAG TPA: FAD-dependent monooxygenase [Bryobacteraceae bacterium]|jgi:2-polyprenyl-6-methoxyphenol hydroxylase-like FAD-dependent oxidoreductase|nr:FAD-dependent monooxygenase [Bryobacteraceae bacterium]
MVTDTTEENHHNTLVLIVGAGPTGLNLALSLARRGVRFRLITEAERPGEHSRAMVVQARTLEFYSQFGFADEMIEQGVKAGAAHLREVGPNGRARNVVSFNFNDLGKGLSPYPFALAYPQDDHERFLIDKLKAAGGTVEWCSKLTGFREDGDGVRATVSHDGQTEEIQAGYICGCDGAHSCVRETLAVGFPGGTYEQLFYVADVKIARGFERDLYISLGEHILTLMFPVRSSGVQRLIGLVPPELSERQDLSFEEIRSQVEQPLDVKVTQVNWFSTYRVHHRVAERFRVGRSFLLGDAGHIHSPVGGQGMNTGIGDAINLGWKLAQVIQGRADSSLLDSYEPERIGFARSLVDTTDRAFTPIVAEGFRGEFTRKFLAPLFVTVATRFALSRHAIFRFVSQTRVHYDESPLSEGKAGEVQGGDRLPWVGTGVDDNFTPLSSLEWQLHVYGEIEQAFETACRELRLPVHVFRWSDEANSAGIERDAVYLVRPDGYVALALSEQAATNLQAFVDRFHLRFAENAPAVAHN